MALPELMGIFCAFLRHLRPEPWQTCTQSRLGANAIGLPVLDVFHFEDATGRRRLFVDIGCRQHEFSTANDKTVVDYTELYLTDRMFCGLGD